MTQEMRDIQRKLLLGFLGSQITQDEVMQRNLGKLGRQKKQEVRQRKLLGEEVRDKGTKLGDTGSARQRKLLLRELDR
jgi:hypothetical protein